MKRLKKFMRMFSLKSKPNLISELFSGYQFLCSITEYTAVMPIYFPIKKDKNLVKFS